jgi:SAM-dependent methyltransferase
MISATNTQGREAYRERLYRRYLSDLHGVDSVDVHVRLQGAAPYFKRLVKLIPKDKDTRVLDLGCGFATWLYWLKKSGYQRLEGVDRSPQQVQTAHDLGLDLVEQGDIMDFLADRRPASCDVVLAFDILEHFGKDEAFEFVDEVFRVLAPGGVFILHLPNGEGFLSGCVAHGDFTHELILNSGSLGQLLRCAGFAGVRSFEDTPVVHGLASFVRYLIWKVSRFALRLVYAAQTGDTGADRIFTPNFLAIARKP